MSRLEGGYYGNKPLFNSTTSPGIWTLDEVSKRRAANTWPNTSPLFDPYFESVSLLLHMDGSNGSTTFVDSSLSNLAVTANGNAQISTAQSKFGNASGLFDGNGDYLTASSPNLNADWTIEFWVYPTVASQQTIVSFNSGSFQGINFWMNASRQLVIDDGANVQSAFTGGTLTLNGWNHVACVRSGATTTAYINGASVGSNSFTPQSTTSVNVGRYNGGVNQYFFNGYLDEVRVTQGVARYTANFVVPGVGSDEGAALYDPYFDYVSLLLRCNGENNSTTFTDSSNNALAITRNGDTKISTTQARFGGASAAFDGTGDYLSVPSTGMISGTEDFTIEWWQKLSNAATTYSLARFSTINSLSGIKVGGSTLQFYVEAVGAINIVGTASFTTEWQHCAICRRSSVVKMFVNGTELTLTTNTAPGYSLPSTVADIGRAWTGYGYVDLNGYIDDLRITKGVCRYTTNFRPVGPYATSGKLVDPYLTSTSLLLPMTGDNGTTSFFDRSNNFLRATENGNAKVSTTQSKFGGTSAYFDGAGDFLLIPTNASFDLGSGDFTIELWMYAVALSGQGRTLCAKGSNNYGAWMIWYSTFYNRFEFYSGSGGGTWDIASSVPILNSPALNTWYHIAITRSGTTFRAFVDGSQTNTFTSSASLAVNSGHNVSVGSFENGSNSFNGYIDDLRITKGIARYISAFTPPERAFNDEAFNDPHYNAVSLLLHMDGANNSTTFTDSSVNGLTVTANGDAKISTAQSRFGGASAVFDGTGDYLTVPSSAAFNFSTGDFTIEAWVNINAISGDFFIASSSGTGGLFFGYRASASPLGWGIGRTAVAWDYVTGSTSSTSQWQHIAVSRQGTTLRIFANGLQIGSTTNSTS